MSQFDPVKGFYEILESEGIHTQRVHIQGGQGLETTDPELLELLREYVLQNLNSLPPQATVSGNSIELPLDPWKFRHRPDLGHNGAAHYWHVNSETGYMGSGLDLELLSEDGTVSNQVTKEILDHPSFNRLRLTLNVDTFVNNYQDRYDYLSRIVGALTNLSGKPLAFGP